MPQLIRPLALLAMTAVLSACASSGSAPVSPGVAAAMSSGHDSRRPAPSGYTTSKQIRYSFTVQNQSGQVLPKADFWVYAPVPQTSHQWVERITASQAYRASHDALGNEVLHFEFDNLPPYGTKIVTISADLKMAPVAATTTASDVTRFLQPEPYIESNDSRLVDLAKGLRKESHASSARAAYHWVAGNLQSETYVLDDRGAAYALSSRKGDCTEFSYLLTALGRANGIPARPIGGYVFAGNAVVNATDFHNWTELYVDGRWQIADAQKRAYEQDQTSYVAMRIIASGVGGPLGNSHRYNYAGRGLEVRMN